MFQELHEELHTIHRKLNHLTERVNDMALDLAKLNAAEEHAAQTIRDLKAANAALQAQINAGNPDEQAAVDAVADKLNADAAAPQ